MRRWEYLAKGGEYFFGAPPSPCDFWILIDDNKKLAAFGRNPYSNGRWFILVNGAHNPGRIIPIKEDLTVTEMKDKVEEILCPPS